MAADLIMPVLPGNQQSQHFFPQRPQHTRAQSYQIPQGTHQISPLTPSGSPDSMSNPTSPKAHHARQVRPMYMPAALRPNLFPSKKTKTKPADIVTTTSNEIDGALRRTNSSLMNLPGMALLSNRLSRTSTGDSNRSSLEGDFDLELFPEVTSLPTRAHWKVSLNSKHLHDRLAHVSSCHNIPSCITQTASIPQCLCLLSLINLYTSTVANPSPPARFRVHILRRSYLQKELQLFHPSTPLQEVRQHLL